MTSDRNTPLKPPAQLSHDINFLQITELISKTLGIHIYSHQQDGLKKTILSRINLLGLSSLNDYYQRLISPKKQISEVTEWQEIISSLTVTESYFFRDQGQFWLLKNQLLPEMIQLKQQLHLANPAYNQKPTLRLWSAGCSTGEEIYSLAILLHELIPDYKEWEILLLGTDINQSVIQFARQGIYSDWSFRMTDSTIKNRYFQPHQKGWKIAPEIREMVTFQPGNLMQDHYPDIAFKVHDLDLILCRNVFIYFDFNAIAQVVEKFYRALAPGGYLITGHTELHGQKTELFQVKHYPQSVVYQRDIPSKHERLADTPPNSSHSGTLLVRGTNQIGSPLIKDEGLEVKPTQATLLEKVQRLFVQEAYADAIQAAKQLINLAPNHFQAYCLSAQAYANLGQYFQAIQACQQALQINSLAIDPYYLLAQIAEEQGDIESAKRYLNRIIYLAPNSIAAYLELGSIYEQERNTKQAQRAWRSLLEVLKDLPQEQPIDPNKQQTVAELKSYLLTQLGIPQ